MIHELLTEKIEIIIISKKKEERLITNLVSIK